MVLVQRFETVVGVPQGSCPGFQGSMLSEECQIIPAKRFFKTLGISIVEPNFNNVALFGDVQAQLKLTSCKNNR